MYVLHVQLCAHPFTVPDQVKNTKLICEAVDFLNQCTVEWKVSVFNYMYVFTYVVCTVCMYVCLYYVCNNWINMIPICAKSITTYTYSTFIQCLMNIS